MTLSQTALDPRTSSPTSRLPTTTTQTKMRFSINCSRAKTKEKQPIYRNSKSKWRQRNKELPQWNVKLSKREIRNMKKLGGKLQFPNREQVPLQSSEMEAILETSQFKTRLARSHSQSTKSVPTMNSKTWSISTSAHKRRNSWSRPIDTNPW